mgnify:CR=1 FL=1
MGMGLMATIPKVGLAGMGIFWARVKAVVGVGLWLICGL